MLLPVDREVDKSIGLSASDEAGGALLRGLYTPLRSFLPEGLIIKGLDDSKKAE